MIDRFVKWLLGGAEQAFGFQIDFAGRHGGGVIAYPSAFGDADVDFQDIAYYSAPKQTKKYESWDDVDPEMKEIQAKLASHLGTKVSIDKKSQGGKLTIEFGNRDDLRQLFEKIQAEEKKITERISAEPSTVASTADIGMANPAEFTIPESTIPAYQAPSVRPEVSVNTRIEPEPLVQTQTSRSVPDVSDLQKEIYSLADQAEPDMFGERMQPAIEQEVVTQVPVEQTIDTQSQYSYRQTVAKAESTVKSVTDRDDKFSFGAPREVDALGTTSGAQVNMISQDAMDTFAQQDHADPVQSVDSVAMGNDFVPSDRVKPQAQPQQWGSTISTSVNTESENVDDDIDLYRLDDFSV